jgi:7-methyl-GTP pyrophosphatase
MRKLILASGSRYRRDLLMRLGLPFTAAESAVDETPEPGEHPATLAARLAAAKATRLVTAGAVVIGSDQAAALDGQLLEKPGSHGVALAQLEACQGRTVVFHTAVAVCDAAADTLHEHVDVTLVHFARRSRAELERYLEAEPAFDCAGGFKAEGLGIALFESIESKDPTALIGLPLIWLSGALRQLGLDPLRPSA